MDLGLPFTLGRKEDPQIFSEQTTYLLLSLERNSWLILITRLPWWSSAEESAYQSK